MKKALTHEQIRERLREMVVEEGGKYLPHRFIHLIVKNPDYDPDGFLQELDDSEMEIDTWEEVKNEIKKKEFDWVWNNTIKSLPRNSEKWLENRSKICEVKLLPFAFPTSCSMHTIEVKDESGNVIEKKVVRNYDNDYTVKRILELEDKYGEIYDIA